MLALLGEAERHGASLALNTPLIAGRLANSNWQLEIGGAEAMTLEASLVINAAGLHAPQVAEKLTAFPREHLPQAHYAKGNYYALASKAPFSRLIYPLPEPGGLGVHLTLDLGGQARFGPDVEWLETRNPEALDYRVDPRRADGFYAEVRKYWPDIADAALQPAYSGIRPKIGSPNAPAADFLIQGPETHGMAGLINLFGIESPGLTAALAIGETISKGCSRYARPTFSVT
jgi:L-2-hydroxyglutarate oxidase LhgO